MADNNPKQDSQESFSDILNQIKQSNQPSTIKQQTAQRDSLLSPSDAQRRARNVKRNQDAWVSDLDLTTGQGQMLNTVASAVSGAGRTAGYLAALPSTVRASLLNDVPTEAVEAYAIAQEHKKGKLSGNDPKVKAAYAKLKEQSKQTVRAPTLLGEDIVTGFGPTWESKIESIVSNLSDADKIRGFFSTESVYNASNQEALSNSLAYDYDEAVSKFRKGTEQYKEGDLLNAAFSMLDGASEFIDGLGKVKAENVVELVADNALDLVGGAYSNALRVAVSAGYAGDIYSDAVKQFQEREGRLPNEQEASAMLGISSTAGAVDAIADAGLVDLIKNPAKVLTKSGASQANKTLANSKLAQVVSSPIVKSTTELSKQIAKGGSKESITEAYQTAVESSLAGLSTDVDTQQMFEASILGFAVGGTFTVAGKGAPVVKDSLDLTKKIAGAGVELGKKAATKKEQLDKIKDLKNKAESTGDLSVLKVHPLSYAEALNNKYKEVEDLNEKEK